MNHRQDKLCENSESLLVRKITGELLSEEMRFLDSHLAQCAVCVAREQELAKEWHSFDSMPVPEIPAKLYEDTREIILNRLRRERFLLPWTGRVLGDRIGPVLAAFVAGLGMTGLAYALLHTLVDVRIHHQHMLIALFGSWGLLFAGCFWLILKGKGKRTLPLDRVAASSVSIALLTLVISFLAYEVESLRWLAMSATYEVAALSTYLFGSGNTFVTAWWIYCCLASFIGAFIFGLHKGPSFPRNAIVASFVASVLLFPAIYLQGSSHNHGYGVIAFAAFGTYVGSLLGISLGLFIRRRFSLQAA
jgi:hypothetical protein